jgi:hypothetical protein
VHPLLKPVLEVEQRPTSADPPDTWRYMRSYLLLRVLVGVVGVALPIVLSMLDTRLFQDEPNPRGSMSAYYYSGARDVFVAALAVTAAFLGTYKAFEKNLDNLLSVTAGVAAVFVAFFPTGRPSDAFGLTPVQRTFSEEAVEWIHYIASGAFILSLGALSITFGIRAGRRARTPNQRRSPQFWRRFHFACAAGVLVAVALIVFSKVVWAPPNYLLWAEWLAAWAFGASWFMSGLELRVLRGPPSS